MSNPQYYVEKENKRLVKMAAFAFKLLIYMANLQLFFLLFHNC